MQNAETQVQGKQVNKNTKLVKMKGENNRQGNVRVDGKN